MRDVHHSYYCYGNINLPPLNGVGSSEWGEVSCALSLESGMLVIPSPSRGYSSILMWLQLSDPIFNIRVRVIKPAFNLEPITGLLCWLEERGPEDLGLLLQLKGSSGLQMGPGCRGLWLESIGNLWEEGSVFLYENMLQFFRWDIRLLRLCLWNSNECWTREIREYMLWQPGGSESSLGCQNNFSIGTKVPKGIEWCLYPAHCGATLGPWTWWCTRKWSCQQACKRHFCSKVCGTSAILGGL